jgi:hypothetical protein
MFSGIWGIQWKVKTFYENAEPDILKILTYYLPHYDYITQDF